MSRLSELQREGRCMQTEAGNVTLHTRSLSGRVLSTGGEVLLVKPSGVKLLLVPPKPGLQVPKHASHIDLRAGTGLNVTC